MMTARGMLAGTANLLGATGRSIAGMLGVIGRFIAFAAITL